ncbi:metal ABC transporter substrate-binding protein [Streptomyces sp. SCSIO 30461]|uniref:metal ABC transporter substrate-binding protein n=1 Tax=Streptomyces sp. SCSIO 30461 TaxID=3118085 RepID=UPI0030CD24D4
MNVRRRLISTTAVAGATTLSLVTLSACTGTSDTGGKNGDDKLAVVASFYPMQYLAEQIGGEHVAVTTLTKPGVEPHDLDLKPRQVSELRQAGYILYLKGVQPAVDDAVAQAGVEHTVDAGTLTELEAHGTATGGDDHGHGEGEGGGGGGHDEHGGQDPHVWLDPVKYAEIARGVGKSLEKADPSHATAYAKNTDALLAKLNALNTSFTAGLKNTDTRTFITTHAAFGYLAERYRLEQQGIAGLDPESEPSPARIRELQRVAKQDKVTTVFFETLASDRTAKTLAGDTGLKTDVLDPLEGITDRSKGDDYIAVMESNLTALRKALGAR